MDSNAAAGSGPVARRPLPPARPARAACTRCGRRRRPAAGEPVLRPAASQRASPGRPAHRRPRSALRRCGWPGSARGPRELVRPPSGSPPSTALIPVGVAAAARAIAWPRTRTNSSALSGLMAPEMAAAATSPTLWPVAGDGAGPSAATGPEQSIGGEQCGGDEERLRDRGVANLLRRHRRAGGDQVDARRLGPPAQPVGGTGQLQPGAQLPWGLRALSGGEDREHVFNLPCRVFRCRYAARRNFGGAFWRNPTNL